MKFSYLFKVMQVVIDRARIQTRSGSDFRAIAVNRSAASLPLGVLFRVCSVGGSLMGPWRETDSEVYVGEKGAKGYLLVDTLSVPWKIYLQRYIVKYFKSICHLRKFIYLRESTWTCLRTQAGGTGGAVSPLSRQPALDWFWDLGPWPEPWLRADIQPTEPSRRP